MIPAFQGLFSSANLIIALVIFGLIFGLYREGKETGKLRGQLDVLQMRNENIQAANKEISAKNYRLEKDLRDFEKVKEERTNLQEKYAYVSAFADSCQNRYEKLYRQTTGKKIDAQKDIKIDIKKRGRK